MIVAEPDNLAGNFVFENLPEDVIESVVGIGDKKDWANVVGCKYSKKFNASKALCRTVYQLM